MKNKTNYLFAYFSPAVLVVLTLAGVGLTPADETPVGVPALGDD